MTIYNLFDERGRVVGNIRGDLGPHCPDCMGVADYLCDYPVGDDLTCDRPMCERCLKCVAPNIHYCASHAKQWENFRRNGGVAQQLKNVVPFPATPFFFFLRQGIEGRAYVSTRH